jgi:hypothetical protein
MVRLLPSTKGDELFRVVVLYDAAPDSESYREHAELCLRVPGSIFRHGAVLGSPAGHAAHAYYAEWEFADRVAFEAATASEEFLATGRDARDRGLPRPTVEFLELN